MCWHSPRMLNDTLNKLGLMFMSPVNIISSGPAASLLEICFSCWTMAKNIAQFYFRWKPIFHCPKDFLQITLIHVEPRWECLGLCLHLSGRILSVSGSAITQNGQKCACNSIWRFPFFPKARTHADFWCRSIRWGSYQSFPVRKKCRANKRTSIFWEQTFCKEQMLI